MYLSPDEVVRLTRKKRWSAQCKALEVMGIRFRRAGAKQDGEPLVRSDAVDSTGKPRHRAEHRWDRIGPNVAQIATLARSREP